MVRGIKGLSYGLLCFLAGAAFVLLVGANAAQEAPVGRYQVAATNTGSVVVDTQTGHLWARSDISPVNYDLGTPDHPICEIVQP